MDLANMREDGVTHFKKKWGSLYRRYPPEELLTRRDELRRVWIGNALWDELGDDIVGEEKPHVWKDSRLRQVLSGTTAEAKREFEKWDEDEEPIEKLICDHWLWLEREKQPFLFEWNFRDKRALVKPNPRCLGAMLAMGCVHLFDRLRFCGNPACSAPYFLARRRDQKYCSDECAAPAKREAKLRWWRKHGKQRSQRRTAGDFEI